MKENNVCTQYPDLRELSTILTLDIPDHRDTRRGFIRVLKEYK